MGEGGRNTTVKSKLKTKRPTVVIDPKTGAVRSVCARMWHHPAQRWEEKTLCGSARLRWCCGHGKGGMSDSQTPRRRVQGAPGWGCGWRFLGIRAWFAAGLVLYFGYAATLAQPPMSQQPVCA